MAQIAAVEGIHLTPAMEQVLDDLDRQALSPDERRRALARRFEKRSA
jgi:hypothetical protein